MVNLLTYNSDFKGIKQCFNVVYKGHTMYASGHGNY